MAGRNSDNTFIKKVLKWEPKTPLDKGLAVTYEWIKEQYHKRKAGKRVGHRLMKTSPVAKYLGSIPNRLQLAGGWIDQPFVSRHNPKPPGSMVVVQIEPDFRPMDRSGIASGTRAIAMKIWNGKLPDRPPEELVRELYEAENKGKAEPSGSQDMIGLIYPGVNRLDYDFNLEGGVFPSHIESCNRPRWRAGWRRCCI